MELTRSSIVRFCERGMRIVDGRTRRVGEDCCSIHVTEPANSSSIPADLNAGASNRVVGGGGEKGGRDKAR